MAGITMRCVVLGTKTPPECNVWEKQLGAPDGPVWGRTSGTVCKAGVKFSGGAIQTCSPRSVLDSPQNTRGGAVLGLQEWEAVK